MSPAQNPLYLFGLSPDFVRATPSELRPALFRAQYRMLAAFYHPDKETGDSQRSRQLNEAWGRVNPETAPDEFERWLGQFLVERKKALAQAEERIASQQAELLTLRGEALSRLIDLAITGDKAWSGISYSSDRRETVYDGERLIPLGRVSAATILVMNRKTSIGGGKLPEGREWVHPDLFALRVAPSGEILTCRVRQIWKKQRDAVLPQGIPGTANHSLNWHNCHVMLLEGEFTQRLPRTLRIVGSVSQDVADKVTQRYRKRSEMDLRLLMTETTESDGESSSRGEAALAGLSAEEAREIALSVEPCIRRGSCLVAGEYHPGGEKAAQREGPRPRFYLLGTVRTPPVLGYQ
jgi:hypothetical protein